MRWLVLFALAACAPTEPIHSAAPSRRGPEQLARIEASTDLDGTVVGTTEGPTLVIVFASWCEHCHKELAEIETLRAAHPTLRVLGLNYRGHEEYDGRGNAAAVRRYITEHAPWLRVVPADDTLFDLLGRPPVVPTLYLYDRAHDLVASYSRRERAMPDAGELGDLLLRLGA